MHYGYQAALGHVRRGSSPPNKIGRKYIKNIITIAHFSLLVNGNNPKIAICSQKYERRPSS